MEKRWPDLKNLTGKDALFWLWVIFLIIFVCTISACRESERWILSYGYNPIRPASTLLMPGAMLMRHDDANTSTKLICTAEESLGAGYLPKKSNTITGKFKRSRKVGWNVNADVLDRAKAQSSAQDVSEVFVTVTNAQIAHLTDAEIYANVRNRTPECRRAVAARRAAGYQISMVKSALMGDVEYQVKFAADSNLDVGAKVAQVANLAVNLGGNVSTVTETTAGATGLVWGIKEDLFLAAVSFEDESEKRVRRNTRLLPSDYTVESPALDKKP